MPFAAAARDYLDTVRKTAGSPYERAAWCCTYNMATNPSAYWTAREHMQAHRLAGFAKRKAKSLGAREDESGRLVATWPVRVTVGDLLRLRLPFSEVCCWMGIAGTPCLVRVRETMAQLVREDGSPIGGPITHGEAGIMRDDGGLYVQAWDHLPVEPIA